jgi:flagellar basal body P-ring protein FlgI
MMPVRRWFARLVLVVCACALAGCTESVLRSSRSQSPERDDSADVDSQTKLVGDFAFAYGTNYVRVEAPVLITGLANTGSDPPPGPQRQELMADMQAHGVDKPNQMLASPTTSLAWAVAYLPPGVHKGDRVDVDLRVPPQNDTTSLAGGWMMQTRLQEMAMLAGQVHHGHILAIAEGPVLVDPVAAGKGDVVSLNHGTVLGGAVALKSRTMGLVLASSEKSVFRSKQIGDALNRRFHVFLKGVKQGVATAKTDEYIELEMHPRYKHNLGRYLRVVRSVPLAETPEEQLARLELLERQLLDPVTSQTAAIRLEAIGKDGVPVLKKGLESNDPEVRFYSAEALAYLDDPTATAVLAEAAKDEPAFRAFALAALAALDDVRAADALRDLFDVASAETRYGAFRALWAMNERDPQLRGEHLGDKFWMHILASAGPPMVHVTHSFRPEVVLFGEGQQFQLPMALEAGNSIIVKSQPEGEITIARFTANEPDQRRTVGNSVEEVIRAIAEVGGDYPDVVQALEQAYSSGALESRFEVDAIPKRGRIYDRNRKAAHEDRQDAAAAHHDATGDSDDAATGQSGFESSEPLPDIFGGGTPKAAGSSTDGSGGDGDSKAKTPEKSAPAGKRWWVK